MSLVLALVTPACHVAATDHPADAGGAEVERDASASAEDSDASTAQRGDSAAPVHVEAGVQDHPSEEAGARDAASMAPGVEGGLGPARFTDAELDPTSHGGTITFQKIGASGWYPSRRDPALGPCDASMSGTCCMAKQQVASDLLTPWDEDLILSLRGPLVLKQLAVYQPASADSWSLVSAWDAREPDAARGIAFRGDVSGAAGFAGAIGSECLIDVSTDQRFPCGAGSSPYCPTVTPPHHRGWAGSKLLVLLASMPHAGEPSVGKACSDGNDGNWYDAPWLGLSLGELVRAGAFSGCHCYAKNPAEWWLGDGCGQFNAFEVVNDNNEYRNLELFSSNFFGYAGYVGEGPCGRECDVSGLASDVDLIDKTTRAEAARAGVASPGQGPRTAFRRPTRGYRYFLIYLSVASREVQLAVVHPRAIPSALAPLLPGLPGSVSETALQQVLGLRLPR